MVSLCLDKKIGIIWQLWTFLCKQFREDGTATANTWFARRLGDQVWL